MFFKIYDGYIFYKFVTILCKGYKLQFAYFMNLIKKIEDKNCVQITPIKKYLSL